jgi:hypothetical protein
VSFALTVVEGRSSLVLVAPHGGRRDATRRPWGGGEALKMNDLHTGDLTRELAARLGASAIINDGTDRNDVDLNRITAAHEKAPHFLTALARVLARALDGHGRACLLTVHGWNVVQPAVDIGLGADPDAVRRGERSAISTEFAATTLSRFATSLARRDIAATPGARYPARARENLVQLFTARYRDDPRPGVRAVAALAERVDAAQLELSLPVRLPGRWRDAFVGACADTFDGGAGADAGQPHALWTAGEPFGERVAVEFVAPGISGLAALDEHGGRLLLFPDDGRLFTFTGERVGAHGRDRVAGLRMTATPDGTVEIGYDGPMLAFPDTTPFVDLEHGLASASALDARVTLTLRPAHAGCAFGAIAGDVVLGAESVRVAGHGLRAARDVVPGLRVRAGLRLDDGTVVAARGPDDGYLCRDARHTPLARLAIHAQRDSDVVTLEAAGTDGVRVERVLRIVQRLPVVRGGPRPGRVVFATCRDGDGLAGWLELPGHADA